ncbi:MAG: hypothetical protein KDI79_07625 [Anaerolineae bacterium]|nr:hypothetical protein [Anaerolineae bacterium]
MNSHKIHILISVLVSLVLAGWGNSVEMAKAAPALTVSEPNFAKFIPTRPGNFPGTSSSNGQEANLPWVDNEAALMTTSLITVTKTANPTSVPETGGNVTFTVTVKNDNIEAGTVTSLEDSVFGNLNNQGTCNLSTAILPLVGTYSCNFTKLLTGDFGGPNHQNTVTGTVTYPIAGNTTDTGSASVSFTNVAPNISVQVVNDANGDNTFTDSEQAPLSGGSVPVRVTITNLTAESLTITSIADDTYSVAGSDCASKVSTTLAGNGTVVCTFNAVIPAGDAYNKTNNVTVTVTDDEGQAVSKSDTTTITTLDILPDITVAVTRTPTSVPESGGNVTFTVSVTNNSAESLTLNALNVSGQGTCSVPQTLAPSPGGSYSCQFTKPVSGNFAGPSHQTSINATAIDNDGNLDQDSGSASVSFSNVESSISVTKSANKSSVAEPGENVTYTVEMVNTSSYDTVTLTSLTDDKFGNITSACTPTLPKTLTPNQKHTCQFTKQVTGNAGQTHTNKVTASGTDDDNIAVSKQSNGVSIDITDVSSSISVSVEANPNSVNENGGTVNITVRITNNSLADAVTINTLDETKNGVKSNLDGKGNCSIPKTINSGQQYVCTYSTTITGNAGQTKQVFVEAIGLDDDNNPVNDEGLKSITINDVLSSIDVTKTANSTSLPEPGGAVVFTVKVKNTSSADDVTVNSLNDSVYGNLAGKGTCVTGTNLSPNATYQCTFSGSFTGQQPGASQSSAVTAGVTDDDTNSFNKTSSNVLILITNVPSAIEVTKSASPSSVPEPGGTVNFTVKVKNTSPADVVNLKSLNDNVYGNLNGKGTCAVGGNIAVGGQYQCNFTANVSGVQGQSKTSTVTANVQDDDNENLSNFGSATVVIGEAIIYKVNLPILIKPGPALLSIHNDNTGGNVIFTVVGTGVSCTVPNNTTQFCGSFPPGTYNVKAQSPCGTATAQKTYDSGPQTTRIFCQ